MSSPQKLPQKLAPWAEARRRHRLSHAQVQMARELGLNPKKLGSLDNHDREPWKAPLPDFIARIYFKRFGREGPPEVLSLEEIAARQQSKKACRRARKLAMAVTRDKGGDGVKPVPGRPPSVDNGNEPRCSMADDPEGPPWF
jgi:hypothetical protein